MVLYPLLKQQFVIVYVVYHGCLGERDNSSQQQMAADKTGQPMYVRL